MEELDSFDWAKNTGYDINNPQPGMRFSIGEGNTVFKIESIDDDTGVMVISHYNDEENHREEIDWAIKSYNFFLYRNEIHLVLTNMNESNDFDWVEEINPWDGIDEELINQLTEREKDLILYIMESETYWNKRQGCEPNYKIDDIIFEEYDNWFGGFNHGLKRKINLCFTTTCENQTYNNKTYLCATIDRDTMDYNVA